MKVPSSPFGRRRRRRAATLACAALLASSGVALGDSDGPVARGVIDAATADELAADYMRHAFSKLPREWRELEEQKMREEPPRIPPGGAIQILVPDGHLGFEYDAENQRLLCDAKIHTFDEGFPRIGLSRQEIGEALAAKAEEVSLGGGEIFYDDIADGYFLRRVYLEPPPAKRMYRELDRLMTTANAWFYEHYLEAVLAHVERMSPPESAIAENGGFKAMLVLTSNPDYVEQWNRAPGSAMPKLVTRPDVVQGETFLVFLLFSGASADDTGRCLVEGKVGATFPDGRPAAWNLPARLWDDRIVPPPDHVQMGLGNVTLAFDDEQPLGTYMVSAEVCDVASGRCVQLEHPLHLQPADG